MIAALKDNPRVAVVWWEKLERWINPERFLSFPSLPSTWKEVTVGDVVEPVTERQRVELRRQYNLIGVKLYGEGIFHRETVEGASLSSAYLTPVVPGAFIYNRLFAWKASFAVVPERFTDHFVSNEFPQFRVQEDKILPEFLYLYFLTKRILRAVTLASTGSAAVSRNRFKEEEFLLFRIPLPPLQEQESIIAHWREARTAIETAQEDLKKPITGLSDHLVGVYRKAASRDVIHSRSFTLDFKDLAAWDVKSGRASAFRLACPSFRPMGDFIEEATELIPPASEPEKEWPVYGVNNKEGVFLNGHQKGESFKAAYKRVRKDWFFHNPTRCNVGSLGIVPDVPEDAITSPEYQVWRVKKDARAPMLPGFIAVLIQTPFFIDLVQFNRVGAVKQRMYTENLCQLRIPYLPEVEQREYAQAREKALADLAAARDRLAQARKDVEAMILGVKSVEQVRK